jgi:hypothetical protein
VPFAPGFDAVLTVGGTDISQYVKDVKFSPSRKETPLPVIGGNPVKHIVGPVTTTLDIQLFNDPVPANIFGAKMAETVPVAVAVVWSPMGVTAGLPKRTCTAFVVTDDEHSASEGAAEFTVKMAVDGLVTFGTN